MNKIQAGEPAVSSTQPDWSREKLRRFWDPSRKLLHTLRRYQSAKAKTGVSNLLASKIYALRYRFWSVITQAELPLTGKIDGGLKLPHPNGIVIHPGSVIGPNCIIFQQVTLGTSTSGSGAPIIGGGVDIGAGARIIGPVRIGDHAIIGANAVVLQDIPEAAVAVGIPARVVGQRW